MSADNVGSRLLQRFRAGDFRITMPDVVPQYRGCTAAWRSPGQSPTPYATYPDKQCAIPSTLNCIVTT